VGSLEKVMNVIKPATFVLEAGEYKDKLPPLHTVELACTMDLTPYNTMKKDFVLEGITAVNAAVVTGKLQQLASGFVYDTTSTPSESPGKFKPFKSLSGTACTSLNALKNC